MPGHYTKIEKMLANLKGGLNAGCCRHERCSGKERISMREQESFDICTYVV